MVRFLQSLDLSLDSFYIGSSSWASFSEIFSGQHLVQRFNQLVIKEPWRASGQLSGLNVGLLCFVREEKIEFDYGVVPIKDLLNGSDCEGFRPVLEIDDKVKNLFFVFVVLKNQDVDASDLFDSFVTLVNHYEDNGCVVSACGVCSILVLGRIVDAHQLFDGMSMRVSDLFTACKEFLVRDTLNCMSCALYVLEKPLTVKVMLDYSLFIEKVYRFLGCDVSITTLLVGEFYVLSHVVSKLCFVASYVKPTVVGGIVYYLTLCYRVKGGASPKALPIVGGHVVAETYFSLDFSLFKKLLCTKDINDSYYGMFILFSVSMDSENAVGIEEIESYSNVLNKDLNVFLQNHFGSVDGCSVVLGIYDDKNDHVSIDYSNVDAKKELEFMSSPLMAYREFLMSILRVKLMLEKSFGFTKRSWLKFFPEKYDETYQVIELSESHPFADNGDAEFTDNLYLVDFDAVAGSSGPEALSNEQMDETDLENVVTEDNLAMGPNNHFELVNADKAKANVEGNAKRFLMEKFQLLDKLTGKVSYENYEENEIRTVSNDNNTCPGVTWLAEESEGSFSAHIQLGGFCKRISQRKYWNGGYCLVVSSSLDVAELQLKNSETFTLGVLCQKWSNGDVIYHGVPFKKGNYKMITGVLMKEYRERLLVAQSKFLKRLNGDCYHDVFGANEASCCSERNLRLGGDFRQDNGHCQDVVELQRLAVMKLFRGKRDLGYAKEWCSSVVCRRGVERILLVVRLTLDSSRVYFLRLGPVVGSAIRVEDGLPFHFEVQCRLLCIRNYRKYACLKQFIDGFSLILETSSGSWAYGNLNWKNPCWVDKVYCFCDQAEKLLFYGLLT